MTESKRTELGVHGDIPQEVIEFNGGEFIAWFSPNMKMVPKNKIQIYASSLKKLRVSHPEEIEKLEEAGLKEANFFQNGTGLTPDRIRSIEDLDPARLEFLLKATTAMRAKGMSPAKYWDLLDNVENMVDETRLNVKKDRVAYAQKLVSSTKVAMRNIEWTKNNNGDVQLEYNYDRVLYAAYPLFRNPDTDPDLLNLADLTGTAIIAITSDNNIILQVRSPFNRLYRSVPGASAAGMWDATSTKGKMDAPDQDHAMRNALKELREETFVDELDVSKVEVTGLTRDLRSVHNEVMVCAKLNLTAKDILEKAYKKINASSVGYDYDFSEKFVFIPANLDDLQKFLTEAKCYMPSTHAAALISVAIVLKKEELARNSTPENSIQIILAAYAQDLQFQVQRNYSDINKIVEEHWSKTGEATESPNRYNPALLPEEQGLPSVEAELKRLGIFVEVESPIKREFKLPETPNWVWLLDVDGVLTDIQEKRVLEKGIITGLASKLSKGEPIGLITGRSISFVDTKVIERLKKIVPDLRILQGLFIVGEKGGVTAWFDESGEMHKKIDERFINPKLEILAEKSKEIIKEFDSLVKFDESKETMVTLEMVDGASVAEFKEVALKITEKLKKLLDELEMNDYEVDLTTIAIDVQHKELAGKREAGGTFLSMLNERGIKPKAAVAVGDSKSDTLMREATERANLYTIYVHVGPEVLPYLDRIGTITPRQMYVNATLGVLNAENPAQLMRLDAGWYDNIQGKSK